MANSEEFRHSPKEKESLFKLLLFFYDLSHIIPSQSVFIRKEIVDEVGLLNEDLHYCMDLDYFVELPWLPPNVFFMKKQFAFIVSMNLQKQVVI